MAVTRAQEIRVGVVSVVAVLLVVGGIIWGKGMGLGVDNRLIVMAFSNAGGVEIGTPIMYRGVRKGSVTAIAVDASGVRVSAMVETSMPLHEDATASLQMLEVMGGRKIEIDAGRSTAPLRDDQVIPGRAEGDISALVSSVGDITRDAQRIISRADSAMVAINGILNSPDFRRGIEGSVTNLEAASRNAREITEENRAAIRQAISGINGLVTEVRGFVGRTEGTLDHVINTADSAATDVRGTIHLANGALRDADGLVMRIDSLTAEIRHGEGIIPKLINDKQLTDELMATLKSARELVEQVKKYGINTNVGFGRYP
jgi:phospholipid/cholesterol/gamma-HCH transport system substrate-binding protein